MAPAGSRASRDAELLSCTTDISSRVPGTRQGLPLRAETHELFGGPVEATALHVRGGHEGCGRVGVVNASVGKRGKIAQLALLRLIQGHRKQFVRGDSPLVLR